jgi:predicted lipoprotein with Yx(FWY)xxD motif
MVVMHTSKCVRSAVVACVAVLTLSTTSCGSGNDPESADASPPVSPSTSDTATSTTPTPAPTKKARTPKPGGVTITTATSEFGEILWGPNQQVVYIWEREPTDKAECYGDCAEAWPPVLTTGKPVAAGKVKDALLGTTTRRDGSTQVTYNGHPLYYYAHEGPGEVECHNISTHGGFWWVVTPAGERVA